MRASQGIPIVCLTAVLAVSAITGVGVFRLGPAAAAQPETLECQVDDERPLLESGAVIDCIYRPDPAKPQDQVVLGLELLKGSVNDVDGTTLPADREQTTDSAGFAAFRLDSKVPGRDSVCIAVQPDASAASFCGAGDDGNTEFLHVEWIRVLPASAPPVTAPPAGAGVADPMPSPGTPLPESPANADDAPTGFVLVADHELSLAIDAFLVGVAALVLWRSRWIRAVVVESVRHPRAPSWVERPGSPRATRDRSAPPGEGEL